MIYDGYDFSPLLKVERVVRPIVPDIAANTADVPGKDGSTVQGVSMSPLTISVDVRLIARVPGAGNQRSLFESMRRELAGRLMKPGPRDLVVDDAPDLTYRAVLNGSTSIDKFVYTGGATLEFLCEEPYGVGRTVRRSASPSQSASEADAEPALVRANVGGNYPTAPVVTFDGEEASYQALFDGELFSVYGSAGAGDLVVDCARMRAYQGDYRATVDINCDWPSWEPGVHTVQSADAFSVEWSERWV